MDEGGAVTVVCEPNDPFVQLVWSTSPPSEEFYSLPPSYDVVYDSSLKHSLTISNINISTTFYCYVKGDESHKVVEPGEVSVTVIPSKVTSTISAHAHIGKKLIIYF